MKGSDFVHSRTSGQLELCKMETRPSTCFKKKGCIKQTKKTTKIKIKHFHSLLDANKLEHFLPHIFKKSAKVTL